MATDRFSLSGARVLLTGASRGIGPIIARALAAEGAELLLVARSREPLEALAAELRAGGRRAAALAVDLGRAEERARLAREAEGAAGGPIDALVNDAAVEPIGPFAEQPLEAIAGAVEVNVQAPLHLARLLLPGMLDRRRGRLVNVASVAGKKAVPLGAVYGGTKAALIEWTSALGLELRGTGVCASVVCPGFVTGEGMFARHALAAPALLGSSTPEEVAAAVVRVLRTGEPERIVNSLPIRPMLALYQLFPRLAALFLDGLGVTALQRRRVEQQRGRAGTT